MGLIIEYSKDMIEYSKGIMIIFLLNIIIQVFNEINFLVFKKSKVKEEFKHDLRSFYQGIMFNFSSSTLILIISIIYWWIDTKLISLIYIKWIYNLFINWGIAYNIYTVTEIKHLSENIGKVKIQKFLRIYVYCSIINFSTILYIIKAYNLLNSSMIVFTVLIQILVFLLGMADVLNKYKWENESRIFKFKKLFRDKKAMEKSKSTLIYNLKSILAGFKILFND